MRISRPCERCIEDKNGAEVTATQTLSAFRECSVIAKRLDCGVFTAALGLALVLVLPYGSQAVETSAPIDRHALVTRHNPVIRKVDVDAPLTVGNGGFAFTADITGLQTFAEHYHRRGAAVDFSGSTDSRATEIERRSFFRVT